MLTIAATRWTEAGELSWVRGQQRLYSNILFQKTKPNKQLVASNLASSPTWSFYHKANDLFGRFHNRSLNLETALVLGVPRKTTLSVPGRLTFIQLLNQMVLGSQSLEDTLACLPITLLREIANIFQSKGQQIKVNLNYTEKPSQNQVTESRSLLKVSNLLHWRKSISPSSCHRNTPSRFSHKYMRDI